MRLDALGMIECCPGDRNRETASVVVEKWRKQKFCKNGDRCWRSNYIKFCKERHLTCATQGPSEWVTGHARISLGLPCPRRPRKRRALHIGPSAVAPSRTRHGKNRVLFVRCPSSARIGHASRQVQGGGALRSCSGLPLRWCPSNASENASASGFAARQPVLPSS